MKRAAAISLSALFVAALPSVAGAAEPLDTVQDIIERQIAAFLADDAATAYAFASPAIREKFATEDAFFDMVRKSYAPVYRAGNFAFGRSKIVGDMVVQEVLISGLDGKDWTALYQLLRQPDGSYRINGVHMVRTAPGPEI
ncbi:DUF4864 domain-containing protein [Shinella sp. AETb1-6]|uniref:DUF4864 domain-containing protein n=1 Tax=Shinella sp. AETb1-6 TaxID=2692210 RepID=UPI00136C98E5|nr:DUF4864 domain-containing protein [Shinella sp. AETb1-6]MDP9592398.1 hypothetical protein [Shinella zoogloeoides]MXN53340.1 DUF4864 domain-containing protein [Shinella sp. AETb1-6]WLS08397.1 DUF4864 domain-containing protein [Shinella sumterensis]